MSQEEVLKNKKISNDHCCLQMYKMIEHPLSLLRYCPILRIYFYVRKYTYNDNYFEYCPWCGTKLPSRLNKIYIKVLKKKYKLKSPYNWTNPDLPEEFKSDLWWKDINFKE